MTVCVEQQSKLEIEVRYRDLKKTVYNCANDVATGWYINCFHRKLVPPNSQLSKEEYVHLVTYKLIIRLSEKQAKIFGVKADESSTTLFLKGLSA
jgi:hypothetical protein